MFSGIVEHALPLSAAKRSASGMRIAIALPEDYLASVKLGDSIAFNGVCLTVAELRDGQAFFDAIPETLAVTSLGEFQGGSIVNIERALLAGARLDGHMVQGHVDGVGTIAKVTPSGDERRVEVHCGEAFASQCVHKGSVCIDGISLTIAELTSDSLTVAIIPHTWEVTNLHAKSIVDKVNLEADMIGKYVAKHLERMLGTEAAKDAKLMEKLKANGFA